MVSAGLNWRAQWPIILITGGARSGKSTRAEARARAFPGQPVYIATAEALDAEMRERIAKHRARRGSAWLERETPLELVAALAETDGGGARLVDCLTLWLSNLMHAGARLVEQEAMLLADALGRQKQPGRAGHQRGRASASCPTTRWRAAFATPPGYLNQIIARVADEVEFVVAGLPMRVK